MNNPAMQQLQRGRTRRAVTRRRIATAAILIFTLATVAFVAACNRPAVGVAGAAVQEKGAPIAVTVDEAKLIRIELEGDTGPLIYDEPVLAVRITLENKGGAPHFYQPTHTTDRASNLQSPLLWVDPGPDSEPKANIPGVRLDSGTMADQKTSGVQIAPGESVTDVYLFTPPEEESIRLLLTVPPSIHGGKNLMKIAIPYERNAIPPQKTYPMGEDIDVGGVAFKVTSAEVKYLTLKDLNAGKGYSKDPLLIVNYEITNKGDSEINYEPNHQASGTNVVGPSLRELGGSGTYARVTFGGDRNIPGQVAGAKAIEGGGSQKDFAVFERPPKSVNKLVFVFPGKMVSKSGLYRVTMDYKYEDPKKPSDYRSP